MRDTSRRTRVRLPPGPAVISASPAVCTNSSSAVCLQSLAGLPGAGAGASGSVVSAGAAAGPACTVVGSSASWQQSACRWALATLGYRQDGFKLPFQASTPVPQVVYGEPWLFK